MDIYELKESIEKLKSEGFSSIMLAVKKENVILAATTLDNLDELVARCEEYATKNPEETFKINSYSVEVTFEKIKSRIENIFKKYDLSTQMEQYEAAKSEIEAEMKFLGVKTKVEYFEKENEEFRSKAQSFVVVVILPMGEIAIFSEIATYS